ncbi:hypothetical protein COV82_06565 [Candidatus Peregrinibacteria bacterium CG11_big_fil_rev_8_21_14_0_20_46_8]|nr:MAG: hypothetical protein COV82_06565 [Candidatus Peregrinibacteria bacterium CG11_big_fil_rev_8_21_14_0_20_46_8]
MLAVTQAKGPIADMLRENLNHIAPRIDRAIMQQRMSMLGLMAVGGKHHARLPIDPNILQTISDIFGLTQTPFHLIHANESLVLAPMPTAFELELMIRILDAFGIIDKLNLQIAGAGRLTNQRAGIVGSTVILSTIEGGIPKPGAFTTTHNGQTGARIMAYDAGIKVRGLPFDIPQAEGRTDKLGSLTTADTMTHQVVHNLMIQEQLGTGPLADLAAEFCRDHGRIMEAHGLRNVVQESAWVYGTGSKDDSLEAHEAMVRRLAETWHAHSMQNRMGVIADMNALVARTIRAILERRDATMDSHPEEVDKLKVA